MNSINWLDFIPFGEAIGWTILHSVWQIGLIGIVIRLVLFAIPSKYPNARYSVLLFSLLVAMIWVGYTFRQEQLKIQETAAIQTVTSPAVEVAQTTPTLTSDLGEASPEITRLTETERSALPLSMDAILNQFAPYIPVLTMGWCIGVLLLSIYLLFGFIHLHRLRTRHLLEVDDDWAFLFTQLKQQMGIFRKIQFAISEKVNEPVTFHFFKPVVLVPISFFSGLTPEQVEVVLLHELAHIRRHDYLFNTLQSIVEILFFYHPAIWWISGKIREEREHCCDDLVLKVRNNPMLYAEALTRLQIFHQPLKFRLAMSLNGKNGVFKQRIFRLFGQYERPNTFLKSGLLGALLVLALLTQAFVQSEAPEQIKEAITQLIVQDETATSVSIQEEVSTIEEISSIEENASEEITAELDSFERLMQAIVNNDIEMVRQLLERGIDANQANEDGVTPLLLATQFQHGEIVNLLIDYHVTSVGFDFDLGYKDDKDCHELTEAVRNEDLAQVKALLQTVDPNCIDPNPGYEVFEVNGNTWRRRKARTPLTAAARSGNIGIAKLLIEAKANINFYAKNDATPLMVAAEYSTVEMVKYLHEAGAEINTERRGEGTALTVAARGGNLDAVKYLLSKGANLNSNTRGEGTPLSVAARSGHLEVVQYLVDQGANINAETRGEGTPLSVAARSGHLETVKYLVDQGANINANSQGEGTPLSVAARSGHLEVVEYLIEKGANLNADSRGEGTPLSVAARSGHQEVVAYLLSKGANINADSRGEGTPLTVAARSGHLDMVKYLIEQGADINAESQGEGTPLSVAARSGHQEVVAYLLSKGANINAEARGEGTPLTLAARSGHLELVKFLVEEGADVNAEARGEGTPISIAARSGHKEIVKYLLSKGADINAETRGEGTPLSVAARSGHDEMVSFLIQEGALPDNGSRGEGAPISIAARSGHLEVVKLLLAQGADIHANTIGEGTPLSVAARSGHLEIIEYLLSKDAEIESKTRGEGTPLTIAVRSGHAYIVEFLLDKGADLYAGTRGEGTPLSIAARSGHLDIVKLLLDKGADINSKTQGEGSPLFVAMRSGQDRIARYLIKQGAGKELLETEDEAVEQLQNLPESVSITVPSPLEGELKVKIKANRRTRMLVEVRTLSGELIEQLLDAYVSGDFSSSWKPEKKKGTYLLKLIVDGQDLSRKIGDGTDYPWK